ncbi:unnamed protein product, partial [Brenthis ino]
MQMAQQSIISSRTSNTQSAMERTSPSPAAFACCHICIYLHYNPACFIGILLRSTESTAAAPAVVPMTFAAPT